MTRLELDTLLTTHYRQFLVYARSMCHLSEDAADLVSQSIVSLLSYNKWEQIEQKDGLKWVKSVIRRQWFQTLRRPRQAHKRVDLVDMHTYEVEHIDPYLWEMLGKLDKRRQYVVVEYLIKERTQKDIGKDMGISQTRVGMILMKALRDLRRLHDGQPI